TAESARVLQLNETMPQLTNVMLEDSNEEVYPISEFGDKYLFITFFYTTCRTVCIELEKNMAQVYDLIPQQYIGEDIVFLSISFDPVRDDPAILDLYRKTLHSDGETWRIARITDQDELDSLLISFGVIVIPSGYGDFTHNSAFYC